MIGRSPIRVRRPSAAERAADSGSLGLVAIVELRKDRVLIARVFSDGWVAFALSPLGTTAQGDLMPVFAPHELGYRLVTEGGKQQLVAK